MTHRNHQADESSRSVPAGLVVFHIDVAGARLALLSFEVTDSVALPALSHAERAVMLAILHGRSNAEIAAARGTTPRTVANQVARLFAKLGVRSRAELAARVRVQG